MNRIERRIRNLNNPYSTAFALWWCHSARVMIRGNRAAVRSLRLGSAMPGPDRGVADAVAVDELLAGMDKSDDKGA